jgi:predicted RNA-binding protein (virulence factor B family)
MIFRNEAWQPLPIGERLQGWVKSVRSDGRVDVALQRPGREGIDDARAVLLGALREYNGFLALHDKSAPDDIKRILGMSKKAFKRALGGLYKDGLVTLEERGVRLVADGSGPTPR